MTNTFIQLLQDKDVLLADGATGTNLFNMGLQSGDAPELWNTDEPKKIMALYQGSVDAGSDLFLTNSFGGTAARLKLHDAQGRVRELNRAAAELGREVADKAGRKIAVAGSVGPTGEIMQPVGELSHALAVEMFHEQAEALKEGGVDVLWLETISAPEEFRAAAEAFKLADMPWCGTMSFDTAGRTMMGVTSEALAQLVEEFDNPPLAFGANCGTGASDILRTVLGFSAQGTERPIISKGNAGIPKYVDGHIHYDGTPELMGEYAVMARDCGAKIIGGCCGTMPEHLRHMRAALDSRPRGDRPTLEQIVEVLGPFSSASDGTGEDAAAAGERRTRRGRRRG
ncbi:MULTISPECIES: betaine--homocysteine S-methyltransferase [Rhodobacterales]|jgi:5-methyltetrahydrofolate--homocysteine methyltransferase|uniref:Betaine--homocysteine S-methyltransferase n=1 Tax=Phaeobacter gallaeciensis TaxID=60890 RepID=A0A1B0ZXL6_9RHOB|nr:MULTISPECIES: betaine--homocysteine S-methyltransferase [Phaeobacter]MDF1772765.1 betaine--homocysteine S-methyltransferase [Pseudophaeobacter sp. bin_em_oilr2.035]MEE2632814.1 betaine--homocysteine S-methyltransferase [Pseudomonadota bacterium]ANP38771.1 methionine synthase [Phaeobacter gallaeciensis]MDE4061817.1 betaine--homocysteine S-methyltransferase [Phaeobacter gallaeciensis]MDE4096244.1 betaine--homocysteine S-methyltransferase [Phaeobacter gallaeciensis]